MSASCCSFADNPLGLVAVSVAASAAAYTAVQICSRCIEGKKKYKARKKVMVGTRKSPLAMVQTNFVVEKLRAARPDLEFEILGTETKGDKVLDKPLVAIGDKGLFTQELEEQMYDGRVDIAVHSCKDLQTTLPKGLCIGAYLKRDPKEDVFITRKGTEGGVKELGDLPPGSVVGTSSLRRRAVLAHHHPHLTFKDIRGNIGTRLKKLDDPESGYDATILAHAGLLRMDQPEYTSRITQVLPEDKYMYAVAQGVLAVECREDDLWILGVLQNINDDHTQVVAEAERGLLRGLEGGCHVPLAVQASYQPPHLRLRGAVYTLDGTKEVVDTVSTSDTSSMTPTMLGHSLAARLASDGAKEILQELHNANEK